MINTEENKKKWVEKVENLLKLGGKSKTTFRNYRSHINRFLNYFPEYTDFKNVNEDIILEFIKINYLNLNRASDTVNVAICSIKFLYSVCFRIELNSKLLPTIKRVQTIPDIVSKEDFIKIVNNEKNLKNKCWLLLAFCCGLRANEVVSIKIENIYAKDHKLKVLGKGNKERFTILPDIVIKFLRLYCKYNHITKKTGYLFEGTGSREYSSEKYPNNYFTRIKTKYNMPKTITFHSLRHSFATYYLLNGGELLILQSLMGHNSLNTTRIYIHFSQDYNHLEGINYV
jgi:site-specific recombinase XerD